MKRVIILVAVMALTTGIFAQDNIQFAISPVKMNSLYVGVDNPLHIAVAGVQADKISVTISQGTITKLSGVEYVVRPTTPGEAKIGIITETNGQKKETGSMMFRVKMLPTPIAKVAGKESGVIDLDVLAAQKGVIADMEDFLFDVRFTVTQFNVSVATPQGEKVEKSNSSNFTDAQKELINNLTSGQRIFITNIKAKYQEEIRDLRDISFTIK